MITVRVSEEQIESMLLEVKCPYCGAKSKFKITKDQQDELFDGDSVKYFCPQCTEGMNIEIQY